MSNPITNVTGIEDNKPKNAAIQGTTQSVVTPAPPTQALKTAAPAPITQNNVVPRSFTPDTPNIVAAPAPIAVAPTPAPPAPKAVEVKQVEDTSPNVVAAPEPIAAPVPVPVAAPTGTTIQAAPERGLDFGSIEQRLEANRTAEETRLRKDVAIQEQSNFTRLTHDALAQGRDSGFQSAAKMSVLRNANAKVLDGVSTLNTKFNNDMIQLGMEKARQDSDFREEDYIAYQTANMDVINTFIEGGDIDSAISYAQQLSQMDDNPAWQPFNNPKYVEVLRAISDRKSTAQFNDEVLPALLNTALNANPNDNINFGNSINAIVDTMNTMPLHASAQMTNFFTGIDEANFEEFGIDNDVEREMVQNFLEDGDFDSDEIKEIYAEAYIKHIKKEKSAEDLQNTFGSSYAKLADDPNGSSFLTAILDSNFGSNGPIAFNGQEFSTYGSPVDGGNVATAAGMDYLFEDWSGQAYLEGYSAEDAKDMVVELGGQEFTNDELNDMYKSYHEEKGKEYAGLGEAGQNALRGQILDKDQFKRELEKLASTGTPKGDMENALRGITTAEGATGEVELSAEEFLDDKGIKQSFEDIGVDPNKFDDPDLIRDLFSNDESIHSLSVNQIQTMLETDNDIIDELVRSGRMQSSPDTVGEGDNTFVVNSGNLIRDIDNSDSIFTGTKGLDLYRSLSGSGDTKTGYVEIDGEIYFIKGTPGFSEIDDVGDVKVGTSGGIYGPTIGSTAMVPIVSWEMTPKRADRTGEAVTWSGEIKGPEGESVYLPISGDAKSFNDMIKGTTGWDSEDLRNFNDQGKVLSIQEEKDKAREAFLAAKGDQ